MILWELFSTFFRIGLFTFGGGYAMLPLIEQEVLAHRWMTLEELVNFIAVSESTPGPFAVNVSTYVGMVTGGLPGALCATCGVVLPSFLIILAVARGYEKFRRNRLVAGVLTGLRPAVIGLIAAALFSLSQNVFFPAGPALSPAFFISAAIFLAAAVLAFRRVHPITLIVLSAVCGVAAGTALGL